jgi:aspartate/methionine/tyrosine aminotransferase
VPFSKRLPPVHDLNRVTRALAARPRPPLDLTVSNPTAVGLRSGGVDLFADVPGDAATLAPLADPRGLVYAPDPRGLPEARLAVSDWYAARHGVLAPPERLVLTASTSEAYGWLFKLLADPGDAVLVPAPSYPLLDALAGLESVSLARYPLAAEDGFRIHASAIAEAVERLAATGTRAAAAVVVNPNNPTGSSISGEELERLLALAAAKGFAVVSDEVFVDYRYSNRAGDVTVAATHDEALVFSLGGLSKSAGLPQLKLGWILANGPAPALEDALRRLEWIADAYLSVGTPVQLGLHRLLENGRKAVDAIWARVLKNERVLRSAFENGDVTVQPVTAGWAACLRVPATRSEEELVLDLLETHDVLVHPGYFYEFAGGAWLVVSLLPAPEEFAEGVARLARALRRTGR